MTTLADINQTLTVQNEMQEKTTKAVESLTKRFAAFLRVAKGDRLEDLESRREARRQSRAMGFASRAKGAASAVKNNIGLISKVLGGLALAAFVLQNDELRAAVMDFITTAGEGIATFFKSDEFREILGATFSAAGNVFTSLLGTVWETDGGKKMLIGLGVALAAIFAGPAVVAAVAGALATAALRLPGQAIRGAVSVGRGLMVEKPGARAQALQQQKAAQRPVRVGPRAGSAGLDEARQLKADQKAARISAQRAAAANAAQQRFDADRVTRLSTSQKLTQMTSSTTLGQRVSNITRGVGRSVNAASRTVKGGPGMTAATVAGSLFNAPMLGDGTITKIEPETGAEVRVTGYGSEFANIGEAAVAASEAGKILSLAERDFLRTRDEGLLKYQRLLSQLTLDFEQASYINRLLEARARLLTEENLPPSTGDPILDAAKLFGPSLAENTVSVDEFMGRVIPLTELPSPGIQRDVQARFEGMRQNMIEPLVQSKIPALEQAMDGAGTGQPIIVPVPIPMDAGKGPGPVVSQGTVGGSLSAGETIHLNQDPATIIGGVPRQQSGGGGGW